MTKAERAAALKPHQEKAFDKYRKALDKACSEPSPESLAEMSRAETWLKELEALGVTASIIWDGESV